MFELLVRVKYSLTAANKVDEIQKLLHEIAAVLKVSKSKCLYILYLTNKINCKISQIGT